MWWRYHPVPLQAKPSKPSQDEKTCTCIHAAFYHAKETSNPNDRKFWFLLLFGIESNRIATLASSSSPFNKVVPVACIASSRARTGSLIESSRANPSSNSPTVWICLAWRGSSTSSPATNWRYRTRTIVSSSVLVQDPSCIQATQIGGV